MFKPVLYVAGSIHQGDEMFSDISRGRQCSFMSFSALLCVQGYPIRHWHCFTVDQLLKEGDKLYLNALRNGQIPNAETILLNCLPHRIYWPFCSLEVRANSVNSLMSSHEIAQINDKAHEPIAIVGTNNDPLIMVEAQNETNNINLWWLINYKEFFQGRIVSDEHENEDPYVTLHSALMNTFRDNNYAFIILDGFIMGLMKLLDSIYVFDSHARNCFGMPDPNGTAVVMECSTINILVEYLHDLAFELHTNIFEVVPVEFTKEQICNIHV